MDFSSIEIKSLKNDIKCVIVSLGWGKIVLGSHCYGRVQVSYKHLIKKSSRYVVEINADNFESHKKRLRC